MARFIDHHAKLAVPPADQLDAMRGRVGAGPDEFGVKAHNVHWTKDGEAYCLSEGPDADSVVRSHASIGVPLDQHEVHEITESLV